MTSLASIQASLGQCKNAARSLRSSSRIKKDAVLLRLAELLTTQESKILSANQKDLANLSESVTPAFKDRLMLNSQRIKQMRISLEDVASQADPVGEVTEEKVLANGLALKRVRSPLGVILMIFESRPNVAVEAFSLAFKSGNVIILRGGKESMQTTSVIYDLITSALINEGFSENCLWGITNPDRAITNQLLTEKKFIDVVVPRGGDQLIEFVVEHSKIPIIKNDRGLCHAYIHSDADLEMAIRIVDNAKTSRPGVCNSLETILVHSSVAPLFLPKLYDRLDLHQVEWFGCSKTLSLLGSRARVHKASAQNYNTEYLDFKLNCKVVGSFEEAISHIENFGSRHSECIITQDLGLIGRFENEVDAAVVYSNASTRFTDGFEFGLGGELGISTQKLHVRGPVGLKELTSLRWIAKGKGQIR